MVKRVIVHSSVDGAEAHTIRMMGDTEKMVDGMQIAALIPEIDIAEFKGKCEDGQPVTTNVEGSDGKKQSRVRIVLCGKGQANMAREHAIQGLKEARDEIKSDAEMPASVRDDVIKSLDQKIEKLEKQLKDDGAASGDA
jgi:hypothetical protein